MATRAPIRTFSFLRTQTQLTHPLSPRIPVSRQTSPFHTSRPSFLVIGEKIPPSTLIEKNPKDRVDLQKEIGTKKALIIGVPAAFSGTCTEQHLPGYFKHLGELRQRGIQEIYVISVNDPFVMNAWKDSFGVDSSIRFLADPQGAWVKAANLDWDATTIMGNKRSKRFVAVLDDGAVSAIFIEPDNAGLTVTAADSVLASI